MGGISYNLKTIKAVVFDVDGVLSPSTIPMSPDGTPMRMVNIKDGYALQLAAKRELLICIISGGIGEAIKRRYESLGVKSIFLGVSRKIRILEKWMKDYDLKANEVAYVGDDIPDMECLKSVGLACCPEDAAAEVKNICSYISVKKGGYGCCRDILEQILKAKGQWLSDEEAFGW